MTCKCIKETIIFNRSEDGGTGRRARFRFWWENPVGVRVSLLAQSVRAGSVHRNDRDE